MTADVIKFPKEKARPAPTVFDLELAQRCAAASAEALIAFADECSAARRRGDLSPAMRQIAAIATLADD